MEVVARRDRKVIKKNIIISYGTGIDFSHLICYHSSITNTIIYACMLFMLMLVHRVKVCNIHVLLGNLVWRTERWFTFFNTQIIVELCGENS